MNDHVEQKTSGAGPRGPTWERRAPAASIATRLHERTAVFEDAIIRTRAGEDGEAIHDLRVASRRLVVFLRTWCDLLPDGCVERIARDLRTVRRRVGHARDLEVQLELLRERLARHEALDDGARDLERELEARLERRRRRAGRRLRPGWSERLLGLLARAEQGMSADLVSHLTAFESAHRRESKRRQEAHDGVEDALETGDDETLHRARIAIKKWRYAVESIGEGERDGSGATLERLRALQHVMGTILDRTALRDLLAKRVDASARHGMSRALLSILSELEAERSQALLQFQDLARSFLWNGAAPGLRVAPAGAIGPPVAGGAGAAQSGAG